MLSLSSPGASLGSQVTSVGGELRLPDEEKYPVPATRKEQIFIGNLSSENWL